MRYSIPIYLPKSAQDPPPSSGPPRFNLNRVTIPSGACGCIYNSWCRNLRAEHTILNAPKLMTQLPWSLPVELGDQDLVLTLPTQMAALYTR